MLSANECGVSVRKIQDRNYLSDGLFTRWDSATGFIAAICLVLPILYFLVDKKSFSFMDAFGIDIGVAAGRPFQLAMLRRGSRNLTPQFDEISETTVVDFTWLAILSSLGMQSR